MILLINHNNSVKFRLLKDNVKLSPGHLWTHILALESIGMIVIKKDIKGRKVKTTYNITAKGRRIYDQFRNRMLRVIT